MIPTNTSRLRKFVSPEFVYGSGARMLAGQYARNFGARKVLLVTDPGVVRTGYVDEVVQTLTEVGVSVHLFDQVSSNPRVEEVMEGALLYQAGGCNGIVAVGGGSAIDCAKGIGIVSAHHEHIISFEGVDQVKRPGPPLVCVPTTAGSSADLSQFAIIYDQTRRRKFAIISKAIVPDVSLIDPDTLITLPSHLIAVTGFDALAHAIEAFVSNASSPITDLQALAAIRLLATTLPQVTESTTNGQRESLMLASLEAGLAFSNASLGASHAMAHALGGLLDIPHGVCNAILLEKVVAFNFSAVPERYTRIGEIFGLDLKDKSDQEVKESVCAGIRGLAAGIKDMPDLKMLGVTRDVISLMAADAMEDPCMVTNPKKPTVEEIEAIYEELL
ncbi:alcohol dehydrogenase-like regulatory protein ErcA [Methanosphaerula palustris]|uniref:Iron-containing alcohol dehydrogenase n=1 Tax=Methanosphaerula palustris (strain ATCC BAA-1556 / DSM 19958 / E1-9c) TaxID=521011 RepID=B8GE42_METPE|nr:alcohol dehydrogenase-like regulatory protein ErcA [Methanosphaerula palustris]ACL17543.1 iron-containing alcohol dehydrogenase [Methanosphaerula palustris E1-9c]